MEDHARRQNLPLVGLVQHLGIELPDFPICYAYQQWINTLPLQPGRTPAALVITAREQWRGGARQAAQKEILAKLLQGARPPTLWIRMIGNDPQAAAQP